MSTCINDRWESKIRLGTGAVILRTVRRDAASRAYVIVRGERRGVRPVDAIPHGRNGLDICWEEV